jgi:PilX N-terminal
MTRRARHDSGLVLVVVLLALVVLSALGVTLVLTSSAETRIAANFRAAEQTLYAAEAGAERALTDLGAVADWNPLLAGTVLSSFVDGPASGIRQLPDGSTVDLARVVNMANCQKPGGCSTAEMDATTEDRPWGTNNPRWKLFAYGRLRDLLPPGAVDSGHYVVVMVGDDPAETDNDPSTDGVSGPGKGVVFLRAEAFGPHQAHKAVELTAMHGDGAMRVLSWRELR